MCSSVPQSLMYLNSYEGKLRLFEDQQSPRLLKSIATDMGWKAYQDEATASIRQSLPFVRGWFLLLVMSASRKSLLMELQGQSAISSEVKATVR